MHEPSKESRTEQLAHFERVVFVLPYKCAEFFRTLQDTVNDINLKGKRPN